MTDSPMVGPYPLHEVISALRKDVKLRRLPDAIYWLTLLLEKGPPYAAKMCAKQLMIVASEDVCDESVMIRAYVVHQTVQHVTETDALYFLVARMCDPDVPRWWESEQGREVDRLWAQARGDVADPTRNRPIPPYALDRHTRRGWQVKAEHGWFDDRFSGDWLGRCKTSYMFVRDGQIGPDSRVECDRDGVPDHGFRAAWRERRRLQGDDLPPDHPPEPPCLFDEGEEVESP
jgi:hypothetical protein